MTDRQRPDANRTRAAVERERRRAEALRANLRRRKVVPATDADRQLGTDKAVADGGREER